MHGARCRPSRAALTRPPQDDEIGDRISFHRALAPALTVDELRVAILTASAR